MEGIICYYNSAKGYGFIEAEGFEKNLFFHVKDLYKTNLEDVKKGCSVKFASTEETTKGISAKEVEVFYS
jgi:cold shock CspA family protein